MPSAIKDAAVERRETKIPTQSDEQIETLFLQSRFRTTLIQANKLLKSAAASQHVLLPSSSNHEDVSHDHDLASTTSTTTTTTPTTPLYFEGACGWKTPRYIQVNLLPLEAATVPVVDRVAGIALQCVYELWKRNNNNTTNNIPCAAASAASKSLTPFADLYCPTTTAKKIHYSSVRRIMGFSLALILIEFLYATGDFHSATELAGELLHNKRLLLPRTAMNHAFEKEHGQGSQALAELLLFTLLPRALVEHGQIRAFLMRVGNAQQSWTGTRSTTGEWRCSLEIQKEPVQTILAFLEDDTGQSSWKNVASTATWNQWKTHLRHILTLLENKETATTSKTILPRYTLASTTAGETSDDNPPKSNNKVLLLRGVFGFLYTRIRDRAQHLLRLRSRRTQQLWFTLCILLLALAWRRQRGLFRSSKRVFYLLVLKPIDEIVKALIPD
ncbi:hypothetical protein ACA910_012721 [Epithemia clementina (nom. ined.)]